jgi:endonuclease-3
VTAAFTDVIDALCAAYGAPAPPPVTDPFAQTVFEACAYLVDDERRLRVFRTLEEAVGIEPSKLLAAGEARIALLIADGGMRPEMRAAKVLECARIALEIGDLAAASKRPIDDARRVFQRFPNLGRPGAERVLLFAGAHPVLSLDSNGLRVLARLGFAPESKTYAKTYRDVRAAVDPQVPRDAVSVIRAHQVLRRHGQDVCRRTNPACDRCPLQVTCAFAVAAID